MARVRTFANPAIVEDGLHEGLHRSDVSRLGRTNEIVVTDVQQFPDFAETGARAIGLFKRGNAIRFGGTLDL